MVDWGRVEGENSGNSFGVVASGGECKSSTKSMSTKSSSRNLVFVHKSDDVGSLLFKIKFFISVRISKVSGV